MTDHDMIVRHEAQIDRIVSDIESEKRTRAGANSDLKADMKEIREAQKKSDKLLYAAFGGITVLQVILQLAIK